MENIDLHICVFVGEGICNPPSILAWQIPRMEEPGKLRSMEVAKSLDMTELI